MRLWWAFGGWWVLLLGTLNSQASPWRWPTYLSFLICWFFLFYLVCFFYDVVLPQKSRTRLSKMLVSQQGIETQRSKQNQKIYHSTIYKTQLRDHGHKDRKFTKMTFFTFESADSKVEMTHISVTFHGLGIMSSPRDRAWKVLHICLSDFLDFFRRSPRKIKIQSWSLDV